MNLLHRVCLDRLCQAEGLLCSFCEKERHDGHITYELGQLQRMVDDDRTNQHSFHRSLQVIQQLKEARAVLMSDLSCTRNRINSIVGQTEKATVQYFERIERLLTEEQERIRRVVPIDSSVDMGVDLDKLNRKVTGLVKSHLDWKVITQDAQRRMVWLLRSPAEIIGKIEAPLLKLTYEFEREFSGWINLLSLYQGSQTVDLLYQMYNNELLQLCSWAELEQECTKHIEKIKIEAGRNNQKAMFLLGLLHFEGWASCRKDVESAKKWLLKAKAEGETHCNLLLFLLQTNDAKGREYLLSGASLGNGNCLSWLGLEVGIGGHGFAEDFRRGKYFLELSAEQGYPQAYYNLGCLTNRNINPSNWYADRVGIPYFQKAAELGDKQGSEAAGRCYMALGEYQKALRYLKKAHETQVGETIDKVHRLEHDIGVCYKQLGDQQNAGIWLKRSVLHSLPG